MMKKFLTALLMVTALFIFGCKENSYERSEKLMGTVVTLKAHGDNAQIAVDESFTEIFKFVENVSVDVKNLNDGAGNGEFIKISPAVYEVLQISQNYAELTDGAFDVTIGAAVDLWKVAKTNKILPAQEEINRVKNLVGYNHLQLENGRAYLDEAGVKINLGGVGKGYAVDIARKIFMKYGVSDGLIDCGTSTIYAFGEKKIGLKNPRADGLSSVVEIANAAISTSGDYENFFIISGKRYHHIIDSVTCKPVDSDVAAVTVTVSSDIENCATVADILSTSIFILGEAQSKTLFPQDKINFIVTREN